MQIHSQNPLLSRYTHKCYSAGNSSTTGCATHITHHALLVEEDNWRNATKTHFARFDVIGRRGWQEEVVEFARNAKVIHVVVEDDACTRALALVAEAE